MDSNCVRKDIERLKSLSIVLLAFDPLLLRFQNPALALKIACDVEKLVDSIVEYLDWANSL